MSKLFFMDCCDEALNHIVGEPINKLQKEHHYIIKRGNGYTNNQALVKCITETDDIAYIYTNDEQLFKYFWDKERGYWSIYLYNWNTHIFNLIEDLTQKELRQAHNIMNMYVTGGFDND